MSDIETLAVKVSNYDFNQIVCIAKGGLRVGDILQRIYNVPLAIMSVESYQGDGNKKKQGGIVFGNSLAKTTSNLGNKVLLVDDLCDSGTTMKKCEHWLLHYHGFFIEDIRTCSLWLKEKSVYRPNYYVEFYKNSPWIHQPMEIYETMTIDELKYKND
tara:strand:+ start:371 stop:844 length:474 start_codon:yes stop_codon:yes gene_type:complete